LRLLILIITASYTDRHKHLYALRNQKRPDLFPFDNPLDLRYRVATDNTRKVYELRTPLPSRTARLP
jgi:hypothetical protein